MASIESVGVTVLRYFNPARSPYYPIVALGGTALVWSCAGIDQEVWYFVSLPIFLSVLVAVAFAFSARPTLTIEEQNEQVIFARTLSISAALVALSLGAEATDTHREAFWFLFAVCVTQIGVFILYILARSRSRDPVDRNYVQLALITLTLLIAISRSLVQYSNEIDTIAAAAADNPDVKLPLETLDRPSRYMESAIALAMPWTACILFWLVYLLKTIIAIPVEPVVAASPPDGVKLSGE